MSGDGLPHALAHLTNLSGDELVAALQEEHAKRIERCLATFSLDPTFARASETLTWCNSYERLGVLWRLCAYGLSLKDTLTLLGEKWSACDNVSSYRPVLKLLLPSRPCRLMMSDDEWAAFEALPERLTVYRGADRGVNERGLCWTLDRTVAERFPFLNRYRATNPVLVTGTLAKARIVALKLDRQESEIIAPRYVRIASIEPLTQSEVRR